MANMLKCRVVEARDLAKADLFGLSDPFCELRIVSMQPTRESVKKTRVMKKTLCPVWNEEFFFSVLNPREDILEIKVYDWDAASNNDLIGVVQVPVSSLLGTGHTDEWRELHHPTKRQKKGKGVIHLICDYTGAGRVAAAAPPPPQVPMMQQQPQPQQYYAQPQQQQYYAPPQQPQYPQYAQYPPVQQPTQYPPVYGYAPQPQMPMMPYGAAYPPQPQPQYPPAMPYPPYGGAGGFATGYPPAGPYGY